VRIGPFLDVGKTKKSLAWRTPEAPGDQVPASSGGLVAFWVIDGLSLMKPTRRSLIVTVKSQPFGRNSTFLAATRRTASAFGLSLAED